MYTLLVTPWVQESVHLARRPCKLLLLSITNNKKEPRRALFAHMGLYFASSFARADFCRAALLAWMIFFFALRSIIDVTLGASFLASSVLPPVISLAISFTWSLTRDLKVLLRIAFLRDLRRFLIADFVTGIGAKEKRVTYERAV